MLKLTNSVGTSFMLPYEVIEKADINELINHKNKYNADAHYYAWHDMLKSHQS
tara:strand:+ start:3629 stop:3787 length:159 start_codon:yes stop_codon:yes gene_type:complete